MTVTEFGTFARLLGIQRQGAALRPDRDGAPRRLREQAVATVDRIHPFGLDQIERFAQAEEEMLRAGAAVALVMLVPVAELPIPIERAQSGRAIGGLGLGVRRHERKSRRHHQGLLRSADRDVDPPGVHLEGNGGERGDHIHHEERRMGGGVHRSANCRNIVAHARGRVDLNDENGLDLVLPIRLEPVAHPPRVDRAAPIARQGLDLEAEHPSHLAPALGELSGFEHQHRFAARKHVAECAFPGAVPVRRVDVGVARAAEDGAQIGEAGKRDLVQRFRIKIDGRPMHGPEHLVGDHRRPRRDQDFSSRSQRHRRRSSVEGKLALEAGRLRHILPSAGNRSTRIDGLALRLSRRMGP